MATTAKEITVTKTKSVQVAASSGDEHGQWAPSTSSRTVPSDTHHYDTHGASDVRPLTSPSPRAQSRSRRIKHMIIVIACVFLVIPLYWAMSIIAPAKSGIDCDRQAFYRHPHKDPFMSTTLFTVLCYLVAFLILLITDILMQVYYHDSPPRMHYSLCPSLNMPAWLYFTLKNYVVYIFGVQATQGAVYLVRKMVAIPRPDFWEVCDPRFYAGECPPHQFTYDYECQNPEKHKWQNASRSFPSGHVAYAFFTAAFCFIFLERRCRVPKRHHDSVRYLIKTVVFWLFAACFASSAERVYYNSHHPSDIYAGALFGIVGAIFVGKLFTLSPEIHHEAPGQLLPHAMHGKAESAVGLHVLEEGRQ